MSELQPTSGSRPVTVELASLVLDGSPRLEGENEPHIRMLADTSGKLPPILVHRESMRVIDGMHRVRAANLRGDSDIDAVFFDGEAGAAYVEAVRANIAHGLPLTLADRRAAAECVLELYPDWSDRAIASVTGLSAVTIRSVRERASDGFQRLNARVGRDGKVRPVDAAEGRRRAAEVLADRPEASLREIARGAGVSVGTVRDVRRRMRDGENPVPHSRRRAGGSSSVSARERLAAGAKGENGFDGGPAVGGATQSANILAGLKRDPSLRYSERGRAVVRWLEAHVVNIDDSALISAGVPPHSLYRIAELAAECATAWTRIAEQLAANAAAEQR